MSKELILERMADPPNRLGGWIHDACKGLASDEWREIIVAATSVLKERENAVAADVLYHAIETRQPAVTDLLRELFLAKRFYIPEFYAGFGRRFYSWRDAEAEQVPFLLGFLDDPERRSHAIEALLEMRRVDVFAKIADVTPLKSFHYVGFEPDGGGFRRLYSETIHHLQFPRDYAANWLGDGWVPDETWREVDERPFRFGGVVDGQFCPVCGDTLHHLLTFPGYRFLPDVCSLPSLTLATCNQCVGWEPRVLFLRHDESGAPRSEAPETPSEPEFRYEAFEETSVALRVVPARYRFQEWTIGENIHRLGGHPAWVQLPEYPTCPDCARTMRFVLQLDSRLPFVWPNPDELEVMEWGSGGIAYFFWCDACRVSAGTWQCT